MKRLLKRLEGIVKSPATEFVVGFVLLATGAWEIVLDFISTERIFHLGVHHGVAVFGLVQMLGSLPDLVEGIDRSFHAVQARRKGTD